MTRLVWIAIGALVAACSGGGGGEKRQGQADVPETLAEWGLFADGAQQLPADDVHPYEVIAPLYSDYTAKYRFIRLPEGGRIDYRADGPWQFPEGTVVVKTFSMPHDQRDPAAGERLLETRLLVRERNHWRPHTYVWNEAQTEAKRAIAGVRLPIEWKHFDGGTRSLTYRVPNTNQCHGCHGEHEASELLGVRTAQLDRDFDFGSGPVNQIDHFAALGLFAQAPPAQRERLVDPFGDAPLEQRARAYLEANCAHCHHENGAAWETGLWLSTATTNPVDLGICRRPFSAGEATGGRPFDIVPGHPEQSVMVFRMASADPEIKMPELPTQIPHDEAIELITDWIAGMSPAGCP
ncbi:SO2930 family diheme c-type cytochrome [Vulgatibacter sp.]|uniref:SO2930 family diheme c-type cytochrome n=1 Tax=Vulgatibacter sp. TaxID=1971226 RepID=UPI003566B3D1